jgi:hypothetical protein
MTIAGREEVSKRRSTLVRGKDPYTVEDDVSVSKRGVEMDKTPC